MLRPLHADAASWALVCTNYDRDMADDVLQSVYLKVLEGKARFDERSTLRSWLFGVIRITALEMRRRNRALLVPVAEEVDDIHYVGEDSQIAQAMESLSPMQRDVVFLVFYRDLTLEECAGVLQTTIGTVRTHYHRAKQKLKTRLDNAERPNVEGRCHSIL